MQHVMVDLETMGMPPHGVICSIGAVNMNTDAEFSQQINWPNSVRLYGRTMHPETIAWWLQKSGAARESIDPSRGLGLRHSLEKFVHWLKDQGSVILWGNGSDFDNVLLANACDATDIAWPIPYNHNRCYRTVRELFPVKVNFKGVKHTALDDARFQASILKNINATYGFSLL